MNVRLTRCYRGPVGPGGNGYSSHTGAHIILWCIHRGGVTVNTDDGPPRIAQAGECFVCRPASPRLQRFSADAEITSMWFTLDWKPQITPHFTNLPVVLDMADSPDLSQSISSLLDALRACDIHTTGNLNGVRMPLDHVMLIKQHSYSIFRQLLLHLEKHDVTLQFGEQIDARVSRAVEYLNGVGYSGAVPYEALTAITHLSRTQLDRLFRQELGMTPKDVVAQRGLERAMELLKNTTIPVGEIAERLDFLTPTHFSTWFKRLNRMTPAQFRKHPDI